MYFVIIYEKQTFSKSEMIVMLSKFLYSGFDFKKDELELQLRYLFFNLLLTLNITAVAIAGVFRYYHAEYTQMLVDFIYSIVSLFLLLYLRKDKRHFDFLVKITIFIAYITVALTFYIGATNFAGLGWYFILILVVFFLADIQYSIFIFLLSTFSILLTIYYKYHIVSLETLPYGMIPFIIFTLFMTLYDKRNDLQKKLLKEQNELLEAYSFNLENYDASTKLPNRLLFLKFIEGKIEKYKQEKKPFSVIKIDLDDFRKINDRYGHKFGDEILKVTAQRLREFFNIDEYLSKIGIDEFIVIHESVETNLLIELAEKIQNLIKQEINVEKESIFVTSSIAIASYPRDGDNASTLIKNVDSALHETKTRSRNGIMFYESELSVNLSQELELLYDLKCAIKEKEFEVYYQPQIDAASGKVVGMEALVRWNSSKHEGVVSPGKFIMYAEKYGLIREIDFFVMNEAMKKFSSWKAAYPDIGRLAINLSMKVLDNAEYLDDLKRALEKHNFNPLDLELEIVEGHIMQDTKVFIKLLGEISDMGIKIAIDDFGTGYSSLAYLQKLPVDKLKIDRSFILDIPKNIEGANLVKSIINISQILNLDVLAEGVDTEAQKMFLLANGCKKIQGYVFSKPLKADDMLLYIKNNQRE